MVVVEPLLNCQRTYNELTGECFTAAFQKANHTTCTFQKLSESLTKSHERINCSKSTTEILEQNMKYIQN